MVKFKSLPEFYFKEKRGLKPNTVREIDYRDERFTKLIEGKERYITIENTKTKECFTRFISDVSVHKNLMIISWVHSEGEKS